MVDQHLLRLQKGLRSALRRAKIPLKVASLELGRYDQYLSRTLSAEEGEQLKVLDFYLLMARLDIHPYDFYRVYFPMGDLRAARVRWGGPVPPPPSKLDTDFMRILRERLRERDAWRTPVDWTDATRELLREKIQAAGATQRALSQALSLSPDALGQALRGGTQLLWHHLFGILAGIGMGPGRFFYELAFLEADLVQSLELAETLDLWEEGLSGLAANIEQRKALDATMGKRPRRGRPKKTV
jgi:transcriptional regulator with XRE-family HTH domain